MSEITNGRLGLYDSVSQLEALGFKGLRFECYFLTYKTLKTMV